MLTFARSRILAIILVVCAAFTSCVAANEAAIARPETPSGIVVGFVGGFVRHDNPRHGPVKLAENLRSSAPKDTYIQVFENRHRKAAYRTILSLLDRNHDGILSDAEKAQAHIILFGQSWGASTAVQLARDLKRAGIPVLLTVQVDGVAKLWQNDRVIPENVAEAVNFYQPHGILHGRQITAADPSKTQILGNYRFDYKKAPVDCPAPSWYDRVFTPCHAQSECDPHLWSQAEALVRQHLQPQPSTTATGPKP